MDSITETAQREKDVDSTNSAKWKDFALDRVIRRVSKVIEANTARTAAVEGFATERASVVEAMNPVAVRQAAEATVKETGEHSSLCSHHVSQSSFATTSIKSNIVDTLSHEHIFPASSRSLIQQVLEQDLGLTLMEELVNAAQTGMEAQVDKMGDTVNLLAQGGDTIGPNLTGA
ncbi:hypothetical protein L198_05451 [Cryptococcus wingfieldii CBS 7118]|uniref:Uncharacterized protein n=1 Tax=Cryptococcus wingfieldii CBS 7118 TaxID=1295528 RepID=A0A1E3IYE4_9TREE|nr:hypothetical protein L198_05451 [Cryptococcus wingfieldii CBS 7118]ODN93582.1 hypothetical protein L198_05451 [Cryptococcus wingfieldii CBS 7118]